MPGVNTVSNYHLLSNFVIAVQGDTATAWSRWAFVVPGQQGAAIAQAGRYDDTLVRENGRWRFKRRVASNDTAPPPPAPADAAGQRARSSKRWSGAPGRVARICLGGFARCARRPAPTTHMPTPWP